MTNTPESGTDRVQRLLREMGSAAELVRLADSARTAAMAAEAIGCTVAQIAKSLIFKGIDSGGHILVIASGAIRADERRVAETVGEPIAKADAAFVRERTGYAIGGVAPIGHIRAPQAVLIDSGMARLGPLWAAAGHPHMVFKSSYTELVRMTGGRPAEIG
jgi:prolyl-tRNA editing enzyme YbaK/EbsC (Cys-tRNA(Pro) deacylase)